MNQNTLIGILIPFAGTALGSAMVFFMRKEMNERLQKMLLGFASGRHDSSFGMVAADSRY